MYQFYNIGINIVEKKTIKQGILTVQQQSDALCMVCCDIASHGALYVTGFMETDPNRTLEVTR